MYYRLQEDACFANFRETKDTGMQIVAPNSALECNILTISN